MFDIKNVKKFVLDKKAQGEFNSLYIILIGAIVVIVLLAVVKPMFKESLKVGSNQEGIVSPNNTSG